MFPDLETGNKISVQPLGQLAKLIEEWNHPGLNARAHGVEKRGELIDVIMDFPDGVKYPRELLEAKHVRLV